MNTEPKRRGRPKNSKSFTTLTLADLNQRFKPEDSIMVGRVFLERGKLTPQQISDNVGAEIKQRTSNGVFVAPATEPSSMVEMTLSE